MRRIRAAVIAVAVLGIALGVAQPASAESSSFEERERAAAALAQLAAAGSPEAIAALIPLLDDPHSKVRYHALWGLARAGAPAVPGLLEAFRSRSDDAGRARVAGALARMGPAAAAAMPEMRAALADPDSSTTAQAASVLGAMRAREAVPDLVRAYAASRKISNQRQISRALRNIGTDQGARAAKAGLVASLEADLQQRDPPARIATVVYLAALYRAVRNDGHYDFPSKAELRPLLPGLIALLDDPDPERAVEAVRAVKLAGRDAASAAPALNGMLDDPKLRGEALAALRAIGSPDAERFVEERLALEAAEKRVRTDYSVRDHQGRIRLLPFRVAGTLHDGLQLSARFLYVGREPKPPSHIVITLESVSPEARFENVHQVTWIADGKPIQMTGLERTASRAQNDLAVEVVSGLLPARDFLRLAVARELRARIGPVEFSLAGADQLALRHFAGKIPQLPAAPVAP
jgi:HEAT repeat protein